jgi:hypothetical protein
MSMFLVASHETNPIIRSKVFHPLVIQVTNKNSNNENSTRVKTKAHRSWASATYVPYSQTISLNRYHKFILPPHSLSSKYPKSKYKNSICISDLPYFSSVQPTVMSLTTQITFPYRLNFVARTQRLYKTGIGLTTRFIGSHTVTHNYSVYTLHSQFTIVLAECSYNYNWLLQLSLFRAQDLLQTQQALTGHQLTLLDSSPQLTVN